MSEKSAREILDAYYDNAKAEDSQEKRVLIESKLAPQFPDLDMRPGTVFGDLILSPEAECKAVADNALSHMLEDMDLTNLENGQVHNVDFALMFLRNFGDYSRKAVGSYGFARLLFFAEEASEDTPWVVPNHTRLRFNSPTANHEFGLTLHTTGPLYLIPPSYDTAAVAKYSGENKIFLVRESDVYVAYVPVNGVSSDAIKSGDPAFSAPELPGVVGMFAASDMRMGLPPDTVQDFARLVRRTAYDASFASRNSAASYAYYKLPDIVAATAAITGDVEMARGGPNVCGLQDPALDLYVRSPSLALKTMRVIVRKDGLVAFGKLPETPESLLRLVEVVQKKADGETVSLKNLSPTNLAASPKRSTALFGSGVCAGKDTLYLQILGRNVDALEFDASDLAEVDVTAEVDPGLEIVKTLAFSADEMPIGVSVDVKPFPAVRIARLKIRYRRASNAQLALEDASEKIVSAIRSYHYFKRYSSADIENIMLAAGVSSIVSILFDTFKEGYGVGVFLRDNITADPKDGSTTHDAVFAGAEEFDSGRVTTTNLSDPTPAQGELPYEVGRAVMGLRNTAFDIDPAVIEFEEVL